MESMPRITVLMPAYNTEKYIAEAIESVLVQTFTDFEFLIINDGSTDGTEAIIRSYPDPRIRVVSRENKGLIASLNEGLALARAPLIARFDADDVCLPERLQVQYDFMEAHTDHVLVGSDVIYTDEEGAPILQLNAGGYTDAEIRARFYEKCPFFHPSVLVRKSVLQAAGGYPKGALLFEDWLLWRRVLEEGKVAVLPQVLVRMRLNPGSVTIDEKWRGPEFGALRAKSLEQGFVSPQDADRMEAIVKSQSAPAFKKAAYYVLIGKKYLWNVPNAPKARAAFREAYRLYPGAKSSLLYWALSFLPAKALRTAYRFLKPKASGYS